ncbi:hypothetical protein ABW19_dt0202624 [Dactylella cylindrospora]|nr:hypothetical protein ABW19_dt0202624 [Dactylella cylindrospora]
MPAAPRKRGAATGAAANSPGQKRLKTETDQSRTPDQSQQGHLHTTQSGHQLPPPQQYHHPQHYSASHPGGGNMYGDHTQAVASGGGIGALEPQNSGNFAQHYAQTPVQQRGYASQPYTAAPVAPSNTLQTSMNGTIHSPYPQTPMQAPATTPQPKQTPGSSTQDLPPNPRIRTDGKGRDPYNIETICKQLGISTTVWDQKLRTELTKVIDRHSLAGQKVIPTNLAAREAAVDEWIRNCPEWLNEPNEKYRKIYAMDRLKCGMADIRRTQNQRSKRTQRASEANGTVEEPEEIKEDVATTSPEQVPAQRTPSVVQPEPAPQIPQPTQPAAPIPIFTPEQRTIAGTGPLPTFAGTNSPGQPIAAPPIPSGQPPAPQTTYPVLYTNNPPVAPDSVILTIIESKSERMCTATVEDFMPGGIYSWPNLANVLREDLGYNPNVQRLCYDGPYGRVYVTSDRTLRNGISLEANRGNRYPKWDLEQ